ncbi:T9SS type A sorting domain-containing protein [Aquimarina sp. TRL1]|uniref:alkaline phosphatase D family protein n=1 Tax=Aquimarina sp. (strain TRL1) TaxID=2736252 RepID=UPI00158F67D9|nr:alkaline phosphatase D family protein [Aquimarina sp. TRL1]QKX07003.1 T9SS type A sorting domain-containing protein [Aquimarina sp. TRL1]
MKQNFTLIVFLLLNVCFGYSQDMNTFLTKIERDNSDQLETYFDTRLAPFYHGVASGDPLENAVIIWTRITTNKEAVSVGWKVATDPEMKQIVKKGEIVTNQEKDYTVKIDVTGLSSYTTYYYQFEAMGVSSIIGKTRTTPAANELVDNVRFAVVSCSNYQNGYFNAYDKIADRSDIDAVIHLGDYIYEYESGGYGYNSNLGRGHLPKHEIISLQDYRVRYSYYRLDPMLRNIHQQHPFINIWDDHEFANDANKYGAQNHSPLTEGDWEIRKNNAYKAYFEWMPIRANSIDQYRLYRKISYGKLMDLIMLDTRIEGRDTQISSSKNLISAASSNKEFKSYAKNVIAAKDITNESDVREILSNVLPLLLEISDAPSKKNGLSEEEFERVVTLFTKTILQRKKLDRSDREVIELDGLLKKGIKYDTSYNTDKNTRNYKSILGKEQFDWLVEELTASKAKWRIIGNQVMVMPWKGVPSNDAWDGYKEERNRLLKKLKEHQVDNTVVLTGDIHSTFVGEIAYEGECQLCEFVVPSVTSQNLDFLGNIISAAAEYYTKLINKHIKDVDMDNHGYFILDVKEDKVQADWYDIEELKKPVSKEKRSRSWYVIDGVCKLQEARTSAVAINGVKRYPDILENKIEKNHKQEGDFTVIGVYPNPMYREGNIHYIVHKEGQVKISLYDTSGRLLQLLSDRRTVAGIYNLSVDINAIQSGQYILKFESGKNIAQRKIIIK